MSVVALARLLSCCALVLSITTAIPALAEPRDAQAAPAGAGSLCIDDMDTEPDQDDLDAIPVNDTVDGGCLINLEPIST